MLGHFIRFNWDSEARRLQPAKPNVRSPREECSIVQQSFEAYWILSRNNEQGHTNAGMQHVEKKVFAIDEIDEAVIRKQPILRPWIQKDERVARKDKPRLTWNDRSCVRSYALGCEGVLLAETGVSKTGIAPRPIRFISFSPYLPVIVMRQVTRGPSNNLWLETTPGDSLGKRK